MDLLILKYILILSLDLQQPSLYIYIYIYHPHHQVTLLAWMSLTLSLSLSLSVSLSLSLFLSQSIPLIHHSRQVFKTTSCFRVELLSVCSCPCWSVNTGTSMCRVPSKNVTYEFILVSPAASRMFCLPYFYSFRDWRYVAEQLWFRRMLLPEFV